MCENVYDMIIVGSGPAGLTAGVYGKRAGLKVVILESGFIQGGQIVNTYEVDNYPGLPGIGGLELAEKMKEHVTGLGVEIVRGKVKGISLDGDWKVVHTKKADYRGKAVVLAAGAVHRKLEVPGEEELSGMGVSYCATCDGAFFKDKTVAVVGGGDVAVEDAIFLARSCKQVYLIHRRDQLRAAQVLQEAVYALKGAAVRRSGENFDLQVESAPLKLAEIVRIAPLQRRDLMVPLTPNVIFSGLQLRELSAFYILRVGEQSLVVKLETRGIPKERDQAVYRGVIDSRAKFLTYVSMVLSGGEDLEGVGLEQESTRQRGEGTDAESAQGPAIYEAMLRAFHRDPDRLKGIADMMRRLEPEVVGEEFTQLYAQFEQAARRRRK